MAKKNTPITLSSALGAQTNAEDYQWLFRDNSDDYISLDTFRKVVQNNIDNELHAWLTFLCNDDPEVILKLITLYPKFIPLYKEIAKFRKSPKELINMYSSILAEMDHNTELYMIEEMGEKIKNLTSQNESLSSQNETLSSQNETLTSELASLKAILDNKGIPYPS